ELMNLKTLAAVGVGALMCVGLHGSEKDVWKSPDTLLQLAAEQITQSHFREGVTLLWKRQSGVRVRLSRCRRWRPPITFNAAWTKQPPNIPDCFRSNRLP